MLGFAEATGVDGAAGVSDWPQLVQKRPLSGFWLPQVLQYMRCKVELIPAGVNRKGLASPSLFSIAQI